MCCHLEEEEENVSLHSRICSKAAEAKSWIDLNWYALCAWNAKHQLWVTKFVWCTLWTGCCRFELGSMRSLLCWLANANYIKRIVVEAFMSLVMIAARQR